MFGRAFGASDRTPGSRTTTALGFAFAPRRAAGLVKIAHVGVLALFGIRHGQDTSKGVVAEFFGVLLTGQLGVV